MINTKYEMKSSKYRALRRKMCIIAFCICTVMLFGGTKSAKADNGKSPEIGARTDKNVQSAATVTKVRYWYEAGMSDSQNGDSAQKGNGRNDLRQEILDSFEEESGIKAVRVVGIDKNGHPVDESEYTEDTELEELSEADALSCLEAGEINIIFGLTQQYESSNIAASCIVDNCSMALLILGNNVVPEQKDVEKYFWGIESSQLRIINGSIFDGHTVDFENRETLETALMDETVYGILVRSAEIERQLLGGEELEYTVAPVSVKYNECVLMNIGNENLQNMLEKCCERYAKEHEYANSLKAEQLNLLSSTVVERDILKVHLIILSAIMVILTAGAAYFLIRFKKECTYNEKKINAITMAEPDSEIFEVDLENNTIYAYGNFEILDREGPVNLDNPTDIGKMSREFGNDFALHFAEGINMADSTYSNRLVLYRKGRRLNITEKGRCDGNRLYITMTEVHGDRNSEESL